MIDGGEKIQFDLNESPKYYLNEPSSVPGDNADPELVDCEGDGEGDCEALTGAITRRNLKDSRHIIIYT
ncbi:hypothetical protein BGX38DRAFT_1148893 [Terfezia claveryi]|nr:hypothetical protein BGX38DRAFT_1148893 [Terfezia claveryi]